MEKKTILIIILIILILTIGIITYIKLSSPDLSPSSSSLEECKTLQYNGEDKIDLVIFSDEKTSKEYADYLQTIKPFDKTKEEFNFYYIDSYSPECEIYQGIAILCYDKELIKKASSCPNDYIIVIKRDSSKIRSSAYMNVVSINSNHQLTVLPHEFGHVFANLADEYVPAKIPTGSKNCIDNCNKFNIKDGCYQGCSEENYFRSIDNGIMKTLSSENYGIFNENLILQKINPQSNTITGHLIQEQTDCSEENYYLIQGSYDSEKINIISKSIEQGCLGENGAGPFEYNLILTDDSTIQTGEFNPEFIFTDSQEAEQEQITGSVINSDISFLLKIPIIKNSKELEIINENQILSNINLENIGSHLCKK